MEGLPDNGGLLEFTLAAETRPMTTTDPEVLTRLQRLAGECGVVHDPVFCLDESLGSVSVIFQIDALHAYQAAHHGAWLFAEWLRDAGVQKNALESINAEVTTPKQS